MRLHETRRIDRSPDEVFAFTADFSNSEKWDPGVASSQQQGNGSPGVGTKYDLLVTFGTRKIPMTYEIKVWDPSRRVVLEGAGETVSAVDEIWFEPSNDGTVVDYVAELTFHNWMRFFTPLLGPVLKGVGERALDGLVDTLEQ